MKSIILAVVLFAASVFGYYHSEESNEHHHFPKYDFDYGVHDAYTGDVKKQWEERYGDKVKGGYSLIEPDGSERIVEYTADDKSGFNAVVKHIGHGHGYGGSDEGFAGSSDENNNFSSYGSGYDGDFYNTGSYAYGY